MSEALCNEKDATTHPNQSIEDNKSDALKPTLSQPEFLEFDHGEEPCVPLDNVEIIDNKLLYTECGDENNMFTYEDFVRHDTIIIKSCTGTGKTTATAMHYKRLTDAAKRETDNQYKFLSIVDKVSLSEEHMKAFNKLKMVSYKETETINKSIATVICINSLLKLQGITDDELKDLVVYVDETDSFLKFTHNSTIKHIKSIYRLLRRVVNNCAKLIVSDATIMNNLFLFLKNRNSTNTLLITNSFKKHEGATPKLILIMTSKIL